MPKYLASCEAEEWKNGLIDPGIIEESEEKQKERKNKRKRRRWKNDQLVNPTLPNGKKRDN